MQDEFNSISECLNHLEFCPFCNKRLIYNIGDDSFVYNTSLDNTNLKAFSGESNNVVLDFSIKNNSLIFPNKELNFIPELHIECKQIHFYTSFSININNSHLFLKRKNLDLQCKDKKKNLYYHVFSDYIKSKTTVRLRDNNAQSTDSFDNELIHFNTLSKKQFIKKMRMFCMLV